MQHLRSHYRIMYRTREGMEPACTLVEVLYNDDGTIAATMEPVFASVDPAEILYDLGRALEGAALDPITPRAVVGHKFDDVPF